ncbi:Poly(beta-D-mannuronate) lyase [Pseudopedobacter saltans DSM 12145]|uniref:Poly(Beta-D-mannuronate) lyase n=2 Tax=Pseudopedobacter saltans TaxID=151895 RepID=F0S4Y3_PSESL|nr:Poly(beta-D-mannuronate) lyase [Pseudopedobacter saltans DSM 12145]
MKTGKLLAILFFLTSGVVAKNIQVKNASELNKAIGSAVAGDAILMQPGEWKDVKILFNSKASKAKPITLKADQAGKVMLSGESSLSFDAPYLVVEGLLFKDGSLKKGSVIQFNSDYCKLENTAIVDFNPSQKSTGYYWVLFRGNNNLMQYCSFKGKNNMQPLVGNDQDNSRYNTVQYCYFKDIPYTPDNGREIFRIWGYGRSEETGDDGAFFTIKNNLFERAHGEGMEIISLKSNRNKVIGNTVISTKGGIVGRSGNFNTIEENFIFGENEKGSYGIRLAGQGHHVVNNYVRDVDGDGLILICGEYIEKALTDKYEPILRAGTPLGRVPRYGHVKDGLYVNNTFLNVGGAGINIGGSYNGNPGADQRMLLPENNTITHNIISTKSGKNAIQATSPSQNPILANFKFKSNILGSNLVYDNGAEPDSGVKETPITINGKEYKIPFASKKDTLITSKPGVRIKNKPLSSKEVGVKWSI